MLYSAIVKTLHNLPQGLLPVGHARREHFTQEAQLVPFHVEVILSNLKGFNMSVQGLYS